MKVAYTTYQTGHSRSSDKVLSHGDRRKIGNYVVVCRRPADFEELSDRVKDSAAWRSLSRVLVMMTGQVATEAGSVCCSGNTGQRLSTERGGAGSARQNV
jgi:hypothetical protein